MIHGHLHSEGGTSSALHVLEPLPSITPLQESVKCHGRLPAVPTLSQTMVRYELKSPAQISSEFGQLLPELMPLAGSKRKADNPELEAIISTARKFTSGSDVFKADLAELGASSTGESALSRAVLEARNESHARIDEIIHLGAQLGPALKSAAEYIARDTNAEYTAILASRLDLTEACAALRRLKKRIREAWSSLLLFKAAMIESDGLCRSQVLAATAQQVRTFGPGATDLAQAAESELSLGLQRLLAGDFAAIKNLGLRLEITAPECLSPMTTKAVQTIAELGPLLEFRPEPFCLPGPPLKVHTLDVGSISELHNLSKPAPIQHTVSLADLDSPIRTYASHIEQQFWRETSEPGQALQCLQVALDVGLFMDGKYLCDLLDATTEDPDQTAHELLLSDYLCERNMPGVAIYRGNPPEPNLALRPQPGLTAYFLAPISAAVVKAHNTIMKLCLSARHYALKRNIAKLDLAGQRLEMLRSHIHASVRQLQDEISQQSHPLSIAASLRQAASSISQAVESAIAE